MTLEAKKALEQSEVICGYTAYADLIREDYPEKEYLVSGMTKEVERCHMAVSYTHLLYCCRKCRDRRKRGCR